MWILPKKPKASSNIDMSGNKKYIGPRPKIKSLLEDDKFPKFQLKVGNSLQMKYVLSNKKPNISDGKLPMFWNLCKYFTSNIQPFKNQISPKKNVMAE